MLENLPIKNSNLERLGTLKKLLFSVVLVVTLQFCSSASALDCHIKPGDARLSTFCLLHTIPADVKLTPQQQIGLSARLYSIGQPPFIDPASPVLGGGYDRYDGSFYGFPVLDYSDNLNGGNPVDKSFGGFRGEDPRHFARGGFILGGGIGYGGKLIVREGSYLQFNANGRYSYNNNHKLPLINSFGNVCSTNHIYDWWYLEPCANTGYSKRRLTSNQNSNVSVGLSKYFSSNQGTFHKFKVGYNLYITNDLRNIRYPSDYEQDQLVFNFDTIYNANFYTSFGLTIGANVPKDKDDTDLEFGRRPTTPVQKRNLSATVGSRLFDRPISLTLGFSDTDTVQVIGGIRYDRTVSAFLNYQLFSNLELGSFNLGTLSVGLGYRKTDSTYGDYYESSEPLYSFNYTPLSF